MMRKGLRSFLEVTRGLECSGEAESGEEAIEICVQSSPHVVIMDLMMPGMGGSPPSGCCTTAVPRPA